MAGDQLWESHVLSFSPESRDAGRQLQQGELRQSVRRDLYMWQVVCPPRHHTLEASPLRARDSPTICLPSGSPGQIRGVTESISESEGPDGREEGTPDTGANG